MSVSLFCKSLLPKLQNAGIWSSLARRKFGGREDLKKFYKNAHITQVVGRPGYYEVNLDQRKLKTPLGSVLQVPGEALAVSIAHEWNSQKEKINRHTMHMTSLCNTAIDNPSRRTRSQIVRAICHFLSTDTLCFRMEEPEKLVRFQQENWDPILDWFKQRYDVELTPTVGLLSPDVPEQTRDKMDKHLMSYSDWSLVGVLQVVDALKSLSLAMALIETEIDVARAVYLSRLEQIFQTEHWGSVEWAHGIDVQESQARVAAATLFVHFCNDFSSSDNKSSSSLPV